MQSCRSQESIPVGCVPPAFLVPGEEGGVSVQRDHSTHSRHEIINETFLQLSKNKILDHLRNNKILDDHDVGRLSYLSERGWVSQLIKILPTKGKFIVLNLC